MLYPAITFPTGPASGRASQHPGRLCLPLNAFGIVSCARQEILLLHACMNFASAAYYRARSGRLLDRPHFLLPVLVPVPYPFFPLCLHVR